MSSPISASLINSCGGFVFARLWRSTAATLLGSSIVGNRICQKGGQASRMIQCERRISAREARVGFVLDWLEGWDLRVRDAIAKVECCGNVRGSSMCRRRSNLGQNDRSVLDRLA